jgi:hypothetical protein
MFCTTGLNGPRAKAFNLALSQALQRFCGFEIQEYKMSEILLDGTIPAINRTTQYPSFIRVHGFAQPTLTIFWFALL